MATGGIKKETLLFDLTALYAVDARAGYAPAEDHIVLQFKRRDGEIVSIGMEVAIAKGLVKQMKKHIKNAETADE